MHEARLAIRRLLPAAAIRPLRAISARLRVLAELRRRRRRQPDHQRPNAERGRGSRSRPDHLDQALDKSPSIRTQPSLDNSVVEIVLDLNVSTMTCGSVSSTDVVPQLRLPAISSTIMAGTPQAIFILAGIQSPPVACHQHHGREERSTIDAGLAMAVLASPRHRRSFQDVAPPDILIAQAAAFPIAPRSSDRPQKVSVWNAGSRPARICRVWPRVQVISHLAVGCSLRELLCRFQSDV